MALAALQFRDLLLPVVPALGLLAAVVGLVRLRRRGIAASDLLTPEEEVKAAIELHEIRRRLEVARTRGEIRRSSDSLRQKIGEELREWQP